MEGESAVKSSSVKDANYRLKAGAFLGGVAGLSAAVAFGMTLASARRRDPRFFEKGVAIHRQEGETGLELAMRALKWGTIYAVSGTGLISFGIWKLSGASSLEDFRIKMGSILPRIPKNNPPQSRTEFSGLNDLLSYLSTEYGEKKRPDDSTVPSIID